MSKEAKALLAKLKSIGIPARIMPPPHDSMVVSDCQIRYRRVSDGKEITTTDYLVWSDDYGEEPRLSTYIWEEGNFSCDCNRENFFYDALGVPRDRQPNNGCNRYENNYQVEIKDYKGEVIYSDIKL